MLTAGTSPAAPGRAELGTPSPADSGTGPGRRHAIPRVPAAGARHGDAGERRPVGGRLPPSHTSIRPPAGDAQATRKRGLREPRRVKPVVAHPGGTRRVRGGDRISGGTGGVDEGNVRVIVEVGGGDPGGPPRRRRRRAAAASRSAGCRRSTPRPGSRPARQAAPSAPPRRPTARSRAAGTLIRRRRRLARARARPG